MNKQQEPHLRFKDFTGAWEEKTLNDVSEVFEYGLNAQAVNFDGVHKYIRITDIDDESRQFLQENVTSPDVDFSKADNYKLQKDDLLFARTGASVGKSYLYNENDGLVYFAGFLIRAKLKKEFDAQFIFQNTLTNRFNRFVTLTSQRSGQPGINSKEYSEFEFLAPSLPEQTHLGLFFRRLDSQITESRAVLEKSRQLKKAMLAKMFPANGEKIPKIRFKGFEGEWECRKLGDVSSSYSGGTPSVGNSKFYSGNIPFIRSGEIHSSKTELFLTQEGLENSSAKLVKQGDILYALYGATSGEVGRSKTNGAINQAILAIIPNGNYDAEFISQWLKNNKENIVNLYLQGGQGNLSGEIVKKIEMSFPTKKEQTAIGNFFHQLDETIALQSAEVEKLNQLKKGLLAAMLV